MYPLFSNGLRFIFELSRLCLTPKNLTSVFKYSIASMVILPFCWGHWMSWNSLHGVTWLFWEIYVTSDETSHVSSPEQARRYFRILDTHVLCRYNIHKCRVLHLYSVFWIRLFIHLTKASFLTFIVFFFSISLVWKQSVAKLKASQSLTSQSLKFTNFGSSLFQYKN